MDDAAPLAVKRLAPAKAPAREAVSTRGAPRAVKIDHKLVIFGLHDGGVRALDHETGRVWKLSDLGGDDDACAFWTGRSQTLHDDGKPAPQGPSRPDLE